MSPRLRAVNSINYECACAFIYLFGELVGRLVNSRSDFLFLSCLAVIKHKCFTCLECHYVFDAL